MNQGHPVTPNDAYLEFIARRQAPGTTGPITGTATTTDSSTAVDLITIPISDGTANFVLVQIAGYDESVLADGGGVEKAYYVTRTGSTVSVVDSSTVVGVANPPTTSTSTASASFTVKVQSSFAHPTAWVGSATKLIAAAP